MFCIDFVTLPSLSVEWKMHVGVLRLVRSVCFSVLGHNPEDRGQSQGEKRGVLRVAAQPPAVRGGSLAAPGHGGVQREGEIRTGPPAGRMEVRASICSVAKASPMSLC